MKKNKAALIPAGFIAICFLVGGVVFMQRYMDIQLTPKEVLAKSIENSTITAAEKKFRHQVIENTGIFADNDADYLEAWAYGRNMRLDMNLDDEFGARDLSMLLSVFDEKRCLYADGMESNGHDECEYLYDRDMAGFTKTSELSIKPQLKQVDDMLLLQWQTEKEYELKGAERIWAHFSMAGNSYIDAGTSVLYENSSPNTFFNQAQESGYLHSVQIPYESEELESDIVLIQLEIKDKHSAVFQIDIKNSTIQALSEQDVELLEQQTLEDDKQEMETGDDILDDLFGFYTMLAKEVLDNSGDPIEDKREERDGRQVIIQRYQLPQSIEQEESQEEQVYADDANELLEVFGDAVTIEFILDAKDLKIIGYSVFDAQGQELGGVFITVDEEVTDSEPSEFFSVKQWKVDQGIE